MSEPTFRDLVIAEGRELKAKVSGWCEKRRLTRDDADEDAEQRMITALQLLSAAELADGMSATDVFTILSSAAIAAVITAGDGHPARHQVYALLIEALQESGQPNAALVGRA